ncbi:MAG: hypothetical protein ACOYKE_05690 [Ferruginibacter sp.]
MKCLIISLILISIHGVGLAQVSRKATTSTPVKQVVDTTITPGTVEIDVDNQKEQLAKLQLTKEQRSKLKEVKQNLQTKKASIENDPTLSSVQRRQQMLALRKNANEEMSKILTPEQMEKFKANRKMIKETKANDKPRRGVTGLPNE